MTNEADKKQRFRQMLREGATIDVAASESVINAGELQSVVDEVGLMGGREDTALEVYVAELFPQAIEVVRKALACPDPEIALKAAFKLIDTRMLVYKERNKKTIVKAVIRATRDDDGWDFTEKK